MQPADLNACQAELPLLDLTQRPTREEAQAAACLLAGFQDCDVGLARFAGQPPWERHAADELLHVLAGRVELALWRGADAEHVTLSAGSLLVVPAGTWHRSRADGEVTVLFVTPREGNESAFGETPPGEES